MSTAALPERGSDGDRALDGVRGLAVLIVFLSHASGRGAAPAPWLDLHGVGQIGVYLFFVLSGFLLTRNLLAGQPARVFLVRRVFRIVPLYALVLAGVALWQASGRWSPDYLHVEGGPAGFPRHLLFLQGDGVFWTIAAEFLFYLTLPAWVLVATRYGTGWLAATAAIAFAWLAAIIFMGLPLPPLRLVEIDHPGQYVEVFLAGVVAACVRRRINGPTVAAVLVVTLAATALLVGDDVLGAGKPLPQLRMLSLPYAVLFAAVILAVAQGDRLLVRAFRARWLRSVGVVGFGWYLLHMPVLQLVAALGPASGSLRFGLATAGCALVAWLAWVLIERPAIRLGRRLERHLPMLLGETQRRPA